MANRPRREERTRARLRFGRPGADRLVGCDAFVTILGVMDGECLEAMVWGYGTGVIGPRLICQLDVGP